MIEFVKRSFKGEEDFGKVFWFWVFGINAIWLSIFLDYNFIKSGFGEYIVSNYLSGFAVILAFFMSLIYCPFSLYIGTKASNKSDTQDEIKWRRGLMGGLKVVCVCCFPFVLLNLANWCFVAEPKRGDAFSAWLGEVLIKMLL